MEFNHGNIPFYFKRSSLRGLFIRNRKTYRRSLLLPVQAGKLGRCSIVSILRWHTLWFECPSVFRWFQVVWVIFFFHGSFWNESAIYVCVGFESRHQSLSSSSNHLYIHVLTCTVFFCHFEFSNIGARESWSFKFL